MRARRMVVAVLVVACFTGARAEALDDREQQARRHYADGTMHLGAGRPDEAVASFKRAYELAPAPALLFNIAQAYRAGHDRERAIYYYEAYLREAPTGADREFALARLGELRAEQQITRPPPRDSGSGLRTAGVWTAGGGLILVAAGLAFGLEARGDLNDGSPDLARRSQTRAVILTGVGTTALLAGGVLYYIGNRDRGVGVTASAGGGGARMALSMPF